MDQNVAKVARRVDRADDFVTARPKRLADRVAALAPKPLGVVVDMRAPAVSSVATALPVERPAAPRALKRTPNGCVPFVRFASAFTSELCTELLPETVARRAVEGFVRFTRAFTPALCYVLATCTGAPRRERAEREKALRSFTRAFTPELCRAMYVPPPPVPTELELSRAAGEAREALRSDAATYYIPGIGVVRWSLPHFEAWLQFRGTGGTWEPAIQQWVPFGASKDRPIDVRGCSFGGGSGGRQRNMATRTIRFTGARRCTQDRPAWSGHEPAQPRTAWRDG